jgi:hypothetical protein
VGRAGGVAVSEGAEEEGEEEVPEVQGGVRHSPRARGTGRCTAGGVGCCGLAMDGDRSVDVAVRDKDCFSEIVVLLLSLSPHTALPLAHPQRYICPPTHMSRSRDGKREEHRHRQTVECLDGNSPRPRSLLVPPRPQTGTPGSQRRRGSLSVANRPGGCRSGYFTRRHFKLLYRTSCCFVNAKLRLWTSCVHLHSPERVLARIWGHSQIGCEFQRARNVTSLHAW